MKTCTHCNKEIKRKIHKHTKNPFCDSSCYASWQKGKTFKEQKKTNKTKRVCLIDSCNNIHFGRGFCRKHYLSEYYGGGNKIPKNPTVRVVFDKTCICCGNSFKSTRKESIYCSRICSSTHRKKENIIKKGYSKVLLPSHHRADAKGYVFEHILVMERFLDRDIRHPEVIHHLDHNKLNNSIENLVLCKSQEEHMKKYH